MDGMSDTVIQIVFSACSHPYIQLAMNGKFNLEDVA